jgi:DNA-binding GntR family transcriptional regulator
MANSEITKSITVRETVIRPLQQASNLRGQVERALSAAILSGEMKPGALYSTPALAERFNVSATPVREAMLNLEKRGLVETVRNKGFRVTTVTEQDVKDILGVRLLLEPPAMRILTESFLAELEAKWDELRDRANRLVLNAVNKDLAAYLEGDAEFHILLISMLGNRRLTDTVAELRSQTRQFGIIKLIDSDELIWSAREHLELIDLLKPGNGSEIEEFMRRHIAHVLDLYPTYSQERRVGAMTVRQ